MAGKEKRGPTRMWSSVVIFVVFFALYSCLGFLGVPYYLTDMFPDSFYKKTGMVLQPGAVKFNPLTFRFELGGTKIVSSAGTVLVSLKSLVSDLAPLSLLRMDMVCNRLDIEELDLNLTREKDGSYDFQPLLGKKEVNDPKAIMNFSELPFFFSLNNIAISNSSIYFHDVPAGKEHKVEQIQLSLPTFSNISFQADNYLNPRFSAVINGSPIELTGQASMGGEGEDREAAKLSADIKDLDLPLYASYIPLELPFQFTKGKAEGKLELSFDPKAEKGHKFSIGFDANIDRLELKRDESSMSLVAEAARVKGELLPVSQQIHLEHIALRTPVIHSYGKSLGGNFSSLLTRSKTAPEIAPGVPSPPLQLVADLFIIDNGVIRHFAKKKDKKPQKEWNSLQLAIKGYSSKPSNKKGDTTGSCRINGKMFNSPALFSFQGTFPTPTSLAGTLSMIKTPADDLLKATGDHHPFTVKGTADLKGHLQIAVGNKDKPGFSYSISETEVSVLSFQMIEDNRVLLKAPIVKISPLSFQNTTDKTVHFGNISIENGAGYFQYNTLPRSLSAFTTEGYLLQQLDFSGSLKISKGKKKGDESLTFTELTLKAAGLGAEEASDNFSYSGKTGSGATLQGEGSVQLSPFGLTATTNFKNFAPSEIFPFFTSHPLLTKASGEVSGKGRLLLPKPQYKGNLQLFDGAIKDDSGKQYSWQQAILQEVQYSMNPPDLKLSSVTIEVPEFVWSITEKDLDPMQAVGEYFRSQLSMTPDSKGNKGSTPYFPIEIGNLAVNNAKIQLEDLRLSPKWRGEVVELAGKITNIHSSSPNTKSDFEFTGKLDDTPLVYKGDVGFFSDRHQGLSEFRLSGYPLASFHEQLSARLDIDTSDGEFSLVDTSEWRDDQLVSSAEFIFNDVPPLSSAADSAIALALLTRPDETFQLTVTRTASDSFPGRGLLELAAGRFQTMVVKSAVSPFLLTGDEFSDLIGSNIIEFRPGEIVMTKSGQKLLGRYIDLLNSHPHIGLHLSGGIGPQFDRPAIREKLQEVEKNRVDRVNDALFKKWQQKKALLEKKLEEKQKAAELSGVIVELDLSAADLAEFVPLMPEQITVDDAMVLDLGEKRLNILYTHISARLPLAENRVTLAPLKTMDSVGSASSPGITISLRAFAK